MSSTPRRNSPMGIEARKVGSPELASSFKNAATPRFPLSPFRASLVTFVSIKTIARVPARLDPFEIRVETDRRHRRQNLGEASPLGTRQRGGENGPMLGLRAPAMRPRALLQRPNEFLVDATDQKIRHICALWLQLKLEIARGTAVPNCPHASHYFR